MKARWCHARNLPESSLRLSPRCTSAVFGASQGIISCIGLSFFLVAISLLGISALYTPTMAENILRAADVPPISGGPGKSRAGALTRT
eukprot:4552224-Pleurochrysis_carterae.AAC.3